MWFPVTVSMRFYEVVDAVTRPDQDERCLDSWGGYDCRRTYRHRFGPHQWVDPLRGVYVKWL